MGIAIRVASPKLVMEEVSLVLHYLRRKRGSCSLAEKPWPGFFAVLSDSQYSKYAACVIFDRAVRFFGK